MDISNKRIVIATHYVVYGAPQALRDYCIGKSALQLLFIAHPLAGREDRSFVELIKQGIVTHTHQLRWRSPFAILNYIYEAWLTLWWCMRYRNRYDVFFGVDPLNAMIGLLLKKLGLTRRVVYYTIDYSPQRFPSALLNNIYHLIDKICLRNADETWNVSDAIARGREVIRGLRVENYPRQKTVPIGVWFDRIKRLPYDRVKKYQLLFVGNLLEKQGVQFVLDAIPFIIKKIPLFHFFIIGGGEYEISLRAKVKALGIHSHVTFAGWVKDRSLLDTMMADSAIAIALYDKEKDTFTHYADPTKLKDYLSAGLPILLTDVPHNAKEIEAMGCGKIIEKSIESLVDSVVTFMQDEKTLRTYRLNAQNYAKKFDWSLIFEENLQRVLR